MFDEQGDVAWRRVLAMLLVVMALSVVGLAFMGSGVSRILSTVGASIGNGAVAVPNGDPDADDQGELADYGSGSNDSPDAVNIASLQDAARPDLLIIRTGTITIEVSDLDDALARTGAAIGSLGGYESGSERSGRGERAGARVVYRVPAASWEPALVAIRGVGDEVLDEASETSDVSNEVVDIEARIRNLRVTEAAFQSIMDRAVDIKDVLTVQDELTRVRSEIEQLTAKSTHLRDEAAMSTLTVSFALPETPVVARQKGAFDPGREADGATARLVGILQSVATAGIWFGIVWLPVLTALGVIGGVALIVSRRIRAKVAVS
jgi:hypothetical protein